jgi:hypothetical protein
MFVRFLCHWPPYRDRQCLEIPDRIGSHFVARCMAEIVTAADVQTYARTMETIDRAIDKRINAMPARGGRREDEWRHELVRRVIKESKWDQDKWDRLLNGKSAYEYLFGGASSLTVRS